MRSIRNLKERSFSELQDLFTRLRTRSNSKQKEVINCIDEIILKIPVTKRNREETRIVFYNHYDEIYQYNIGGGYFGKYSVSSERFNVDDISIELKREKDLYYLLNPLASELGNKYERLSRGNKWPCLRVKELLEIKVISYLEDKYKNIEPYHIPRVLPIVINNTKYIYSVDISNYKKFFLVGECIIEDTEL